MARSYKQKCMKCKKNYVKVTFRNRFPVCYECLKAELNTPIEDPEMKKLFDIPEELYEESAFLRDIKLKYIRFGSLTEKQIEAFKKVVKDMLD
ncbi:hypothetical protein GF342_03175 [Candidatus Woesearchaeota archaeon]|nr:hypothetical protein [Candidatus Woesearchaeota archaeon]